MGRPRKSVEEHIRAGTYRADRHGPKPAPLPTPKNGLIKPPLDELSGKAWDELVAQLSARLQPEDCFELEQAAVWLAKTRLIVLALDKAKPGTLPFTRLVSAASTASKNFDRIAKRFGVTPGDRERLKLPTPAPTGGPKRW